jgi:hypothetical protein
MGASLARSAAASMVKGAVVGGMVIAIFAPGASRAQTAGGSIPSYALPSYASHELTISGRIASIAGKYDIEVRDDGGYIDHVQLHEGTVINPTGLQLAPGLSVRIMGYNRGSVFAANEIDTPYTTYPAYAAAPLYPAYPAYVPYYFGYGSYWAPGIGTTIGWGGFGITIGWGGYWGGYYGYGYRGGYGYGGGYRGGYGYGGGYRGGYGYGGGYRGGYGYGGGYRGGYGGGHR